jgi:hypothetical protein
MSPTVPDLSDVVIPTKTVVVQQAIGERPKVAVEVFGLNTEDLIYLVHKHGMVFAAYFLRNVKENVENKASARELLMAFPSFSDDIVACGCKQREASEHVASFVIPIKIELLATVLDLTFPTGLKKSLENLLPLVLQLLIKFGYMKLSEEELAKMQEQVS